MEIDEKIENIFYNSPEQKSRSNLFQMTKKIANRNHLSNNNLLVNNIKLSSPYRNNDYKYKKSKKSYDRTEDLFYFEFIKKLKSEDISPKYNPSVNNSKISKKKQSQIKKSGKKEKNAKEISNINSDIIKLNLIEGDNNENTIKKKKNQFQDGIMGVCKINNNQNLNNQNLLSTQNKKTKIAKIESNVDIDKNNVDINKNKIQKAVELELINHLKKFDILEVESKTNLQNVKYSKDDFHLRKISKDSNLVTNNVTKREINNIEKESEVNNMNEAVIYYSMPTENKKKKMFFCCF